MRQKPVHHDESGQFQCPSCGTSAFEVVGTHVDLSEQGRPERSLTLQCLDCLERFSHRLTSQGPHTMPAESDQQIALAGSTSGSHQGMPFPY